jgi:hypothetical protein
MKRAFGSIRQLGSGRWQVRYLDPFTGEALNGPMTFERRGDAVRWLATVEADIARGVWEDKSKAAKVTVAEYAERWLASDPNKRLSTLARDRQALLAAAAAWACGSGRSSLALPTPVAWRMVQSAASRAWSGAREGTGSAGVERCVAWP